MTWRWAAKGKGHDESDQCGGGDHLSLGKHHTREGLTFRTALASGCSLGFLDRAKDGSPRPVSLGGAWSYPVSLMGSRQAALPRACIPGSKGISDVGSVHPLFPTIRDVICSLRRG
jgi:hypothetical protein